MYRQIGTWTFPLTNAFKIVKGLFRAVDSPRAGILSTAHKISVARSGCGGISKVAKLENTNPVDHILILE